MFEKNQKLFILTKSIWKQGIKIPDRYMQVYHNGSLSFDTLLISRTAFLQDAALYKATSHKNVVFLHSFWMESSLLHHLHGCILILVLCRGMRAYEGPNGELIQESDTRIDVWGR